MKVDKISHHGYNLQTNGKIKASMSFGILHDDGQCWDSVGVDMLLDRDDSLTVGQIQELALERAYQILALIEQPG